MAEVRKTRPTGVAKKSLRKAKHDDTADFKLSTVVTMPSDTLQDYSILLFGEKKIGKTRLASLFPDSYFIECEPGTKGVVHRGDPCGSWALFKKMVRLLRTDKSRTVIVDTVDMAFSMCDDYVCAKLGVDDVSEEDWGKGWRALRKEFTDTMQKLMSMNKGVILISHSTEKEIKTRSGRKYDRVQPTMAGQARDICEAIVDIWAYFHYDGDARVLTIRGDEHISAGHRLDTRFQWEGKAVRSIYMTDNPEQGIANFKACFNNKYKPRPDDVEEPEEDGAEPKKKVVIKRRK